MGGSVTITGGTLTASGGIWGAGIGAGDYGAFDAITITGGTVTASSALDGAGIGGGNGAGSGSVDISGGTVIATSEQVGAGIGGGSGGAGGTVTISGGTVTATGGLGGGAGIGGGYGGGAGGTVTISGGTVTATGGLGGGAGIGGGLYGGVGGTVTISGGTVTAASPGPATAVGGGIDGTSDAAFGSLQIDAPGTLVLGSPLRVPAGATVTGDGFLQGTAASTNDGAIQLPTENIQWDGLGLGPHHYLVHFHSAATTPDIHVFAATFTDGARTLPTGTNWYTRPAGAGPVTADTDLSALATDGELDLYAAPRRTLQLTPGDPAPTPASTPIATTAAELPPTGANPAAALGATGLLAAVGILLLVRGRRSRSAH